MLNSTFLFLSRQIYYDYIEGKSSQSENIYQKKTDERKVALHEKILKEYLEKMGEVTEAARSINWVTHQKCKDMFILSKVRRKATPLSSQAIGLQSTNWAKVAYTLDRYITLSLILSSRRNGFSKPIPN